MVARLRARTVACPSGQATVELALMLPLVVLLLLAILQVALIVRDHVALQHAAREAVRAASVDRDPAAARAAAHRVVARAHVDVGSRPRIGGSIEVKVSLRSRTELPLVGALFPDPVLRAAATMRTER